eukprot:m51a1_g3871 hypothetical protein (708) ;mRNA; f:434497-437751
MDSGTGGRDPKLSVRELFARVAPSGVVRAEGLAELLGCLGMPTSRMVLDEVLARVDMNHSGSVESKAFVEWWCQEDVAALSRRLSLLSLTAPFATASVDFAKLISWLTSKTCPEKSAVQLRLIESYKRDKMIFEDQEFGESTWMHARCFIDGPTLFGERISPCCIIQGGLGDCFLLSALSVLAERPHRIRALFCRHTDNGYGCYCVSMHHQGLSSDVILDERFPVEDPERVEPSLCPRRKAYAKVNDGYGNIMSGDVVTAMTDLTGAPVVVKDCDNDWEQWHPGAMFGFLLDHKRSGHTVCCSLRSELPSTVVRHLGLVSNHSYALLQVREVYLNGSAPAVRVVQLRNPWGDTEWNGAWSEDDTVWTEELRSALNAQVGDDGVFWMALEDFCDHFGRVVVSLVQDGYRSTTIAHSMASDADAFSVVAGSECRASLTLFQHDIQADQYGNPPALRLRLSRAEPPFDLVVESSPLFVSCEQLFSPECALSQGKYTLTVERHPLFASSDVSFALGLYCSASDVSIRPAAQTRALPPSPPTTPAPLPPSMAAMMVTTPRLIARPAWVPLLPGTRIPAVSVGGRPACHNPLTCALFFSGDKSSELWAEHAAQRSHVCLEGAACPALADAEHCWVAMHMDKDECPDGPLCPHTTNPGHRYMFRHAGLWDFMLRCRLGPTCRLRGVASHDLRYFHCEWSPEVPMCSADDRRVWR